MKILDLITHFYNNMILNGSTYAQKLTRETQLLSLITLIGENISSIPENCLIVDSTAKIVSLITGCDWNLEDLIAIITYGQLVLSTKKEYLASKAAVLSSLAALAKRDTDLITKIATPACIHNIMECLKKPVTDIDGSEAAFRNALDCMASIVVTEDENIILHVLQAGFLRRAHDILNCGTSNDKRQALWAISNITASSTHVKEVIEIANGTLIERVM